MFIFVSRTRTRPFAMGCLNAKRPPLRRHYKSPVAQHGGHSPAGSNGRGAAVSDVSEGIAPHAIPSGTGCVECLAAGQWWFHLRRCAKCGHIGCCDTSPNQHATAHFRETGHFVITSFEPDEDWFWNYPRENRSTAPGWRLRGRGHWISLPLDQRGVSLRIGKITLTNSSRSAIRPARNEYDCPPKEEPMYYQVVSQCTQSLKNVEGWLDKAQQFAAAT